MNSVGFGPSDGRERMANVTEYSARQITEFGAEMRQSFATKWTSRAAKSQGDQWRLLPEKPDWPAQYPSLVSRSMTFRPR